MVEKVIKGDSDCSIELFNLIFFCFRAMFGTKDVTAYDVIMQWLPYYFFPFLKRKQT